MSQQKLINARIATQLIFLVCGLGVSSWAPMVPYAKDRLGLHEGQLGLLLLFLGFGALLTMPLTGLLLKRWGSRKIILAATLVVATMLSLLLLIQSVPLMACALFVFGAGIGSVDVAMNAHGVNVQNAYSRSIMSSLHGLFSVGGLLGSLGLGFLVKAGLQPLQAAIGISILLILITLSQYKRLFSLQTEQKLTSQHSAEKDKSLQSKRFHWLQWPVISLGLLCFCLFLTEGAMLDWSAVYLRDNKHVATEFSGLGYAAFSVAMAIMRLLGDKLVERLNSLKVVVGGCILAATGLLLAMSATWVPIVLVGYILLGIGAANVVPMFISDGGRLNGISPLSSIPVITTMGYAGQLAGPAILGFIAHHLSLTVAFGFTASFLIITAISYYFMKAGVHGNTSKQLLCK
jgi:predicted MFS family arabinose efflux permease